jgi:hypothetical protein
MKKLVIEMLYPGEVSQSDFSEVRADTKEASRLAENI